MFCQNFVNNVSNILINTSGVQVFLTIIANGDGVEVEPSLLIGNKFLKNAKGYDFFLVLAKSYQAILEPTQSLYTLTLAGGWTFNTKKAVDDVDEAGGENFSGVVVGGGVEHM